MNIIEKYFPEISPKQKEQFGQLLPLYTEWNEKINVISRKDIDSLYEHHVLHSLGIAKVIQFKPQTSILDIGTGGGFPGIPLAIMFPEPQFHLIDSIGKKIKVVNEVASALGLENVVVSHLRGQEVKDHYDFVVSRAVTNLKDFLKFGDHKFKKKNNHELANGILYLKGGDFLDELKSVRKNYQLFNLSDYFDEPFFETKKLVHLSK